MPNYDKNSPETIQLLFGSIAKNYDRTNAVLSFQLHRFWNAQLIRMVTQHGSPETLLDLCCGTGEIAFGMLKKSTKPQKAYLLDFCEEMLQCARQKAKSLDLTSHQLSYLQADAQAIPLPDESVHCATVAYGIRNVKDPYTCIQDVYRVLKPGGVFGILELTEPSNPLLRAGHGFYLRNILPIVGKWATSNEAAYQYLCNSISNFVKPVEIESMMRQAGFAKTTKKPLIGGIATIILGNKQH